MSPPSVDHVILGMCACGLMIVGEAGEAMVAKSLSVFRQSWFLCPRASKADVLETLLINVKWDRGVQRLQLKTRKKVVKSWWTATK